jgi:transposase-like protein
MIIQVPHCPHCHRIDIVRHGKSPEGKQRYRCRECRQGCGCTFLLDYAYAGQSPEVKRQTVDMALNASGIRDTAHVLHVSPTTVINELRLATHGVAPAVESVACVGTPPERPPGHFFCLPVKPLLHRLFPQRHESAVHKTP